MNGNPPENEQYLSASFKTQSYKFLHESMLKPLKADEAEKELSKIGSFSTLDLVIKLTMDARMGDVNNPFKHGEDAFNPFYDHPQAYSIRSTVFKNTQAYIKHLVYEVYSGDSKTVDSYIFNEHPVRFHLNNSAIFDPLNARDKKNYNPRNEAIYAHIRQNELIISLFNFKSNNPENFVDYCDTLIKNHQTHMLFCEKFINKLIDETIAKAPNSSLLEKDAIKNKIQQEYVFTTLANTEHLVFLTNIKKHFENIDADDIVAKRKELIAKRKELIANTKALFQKLDDNNDKSVSLDSLNYYRSTIHPSDPNNLSSAKF